MRYIALSFLLLLQSVFALLTNDIHAGQRPETLFSDFKSKEDLKSGTKQYLNDIDENSGQETLGTSTGDIIGNNADENLISVSYDLEALPFPTRRMHQLILEATKSGDIEKLRALIGVGESATQLSFGGFDGDPIEFLKSQSGDSDGFEIMAILEEILESGYVHMDKGTDHEIFVWPYFFGVSLDELSPKEKVELFRIVTYGDFVEFKDFGGYIFYRAGISPSGRWQFFVAGD